MPKRQYAVGRCGGFTLVELMFVVAVAIILVGLGAPSFSNVLKQNRITASVNDVISSFQQARSEAAKRGLAVRLCPSSGAPGADDCAGTDWAAGAVAFVDVNGDGARGGVDEELLFVRGPMPRDVFVNASAPVAGGVSFGSDGFPINLLSATQLVFCDEAGSQTRRRIVSLSSTGRPATGRTLTVEGGLEC